MEPQYLNQKDVSILTGLSVGKLQNDRYYSRGIPYVKFGGAVRYSLKDVLHFMESHKVLTAA